MFGALTRLGTVVEPVDGPPDVAPDPSRRRPRFGLEVFLVLGVSLGASGIYSLLELIDAELTVKGGISGTTANIISQQSTREILDFFYQLYGVVHGVIPAGLALLLLSRTPALAGFGVGLDRLRQRWGRETLYGVGFAALIGIPGLGLVYAAHELGLAANLAVATLPDVWYRYPILVLSAIQNGIIEEVVVVGYCLTRFRQMQWNPWVAIAVAAVIRGSYHLYQGFGGFAGNAVMGLIFGYWFTRTRRVFPLIVAHSILDIVSFVGYTLLHNHISWI